MRELRRLANTVLQPGFDGMTPPDWLRRALADGLGGVLLWNRDFTGSARLLELTDALRAENPDVLVAIAEGGEVTCLDGTSGSPWPSNAALGVVDDVDVTRAVASAIGCDLVTAGVSMKYAPVADTNINPSNPVIGVRSFGADYDRVAAHTAAFVTGLQAQGVAACAKHFPGHGDTSVDSHLGLPVVADDASSLAAGALKPFRAAVASGVRAVMSAHIMLPAIDGVPATLSRRLLTGMLREELGYDGVIITDAIEMAAIEQTYGLEEAAVRAITAGADTVFIGGWHDAQSSVSRIRDALIAAVCSGRLSQARLAEAAGRTRRLVAWSASARHDSNPTVDHGIGLAAAQRALRVVGPLAPLQAPPYVIELAPQVNAHGPQTAWGLIPALTRRWPATTGHRLTGPPDDVATLIAGTAGRPLVIVVRDAHRYHWVAATLRTAFTVRPDATVVEMGLPHGDIPPCGAYLATYGATAVSSLVAAMALTDGRYQTG
jgi:beta-N-acetylhexosaminidase